jgi:tetratricopeptide (TPR) repeat protein
MTYAFSSDDYEKGIEPLKKALSLNPRADWYAANLANAYLRARKPDDALPLFQQLQASSNPQIAAMAGQMLIQIQHLKSGNVRWAQAKDLKPNSTSADDDDEGEANASATTVKVDAASSNSATAKSAPLSFMRGTILAMDCSAKPAVMATVKSEGKTWKLHAADASKVATRSPKEFCALANKPVEVLYHKTGVDRGEIVGLDVESNGR